jgi:hypothetical protein
MTPTSHIASRIVLGSNRTEGEFVRADDASTLVVMPILDVRPVDDCCPG